MIKKQSTRMLSAPPVLELLGLVPAETQHITRKSSDVFSSAYRRSERGWDLNSLLKSLHRRAGISGQAIFNGAGATMWLFLPMKHYSSNGHQRVLVYFDLNLNCTHFSAYLGLKISIESVQLHKPVIVPVVQGLRAQTDAIIKAYTALYDGVYCIVGPTELPGWPGAQGIEHMRQRVSDKIDGFLGKLDDVIERELRDAKKAK